MDFEGTAWCLKPLKQGPLWCLEGTNCIRYIVLTNFCSAQKGVRRQLNMYIYTQYSNNNDNDNSDNVNNNNNSLL
jgi:hypothetical protein